MKCSRGHVKQKDKHGKCPKCSRVISKKWRIDNRKYYNTYQQEYRVITINRLKNLLKNKNEIYFVLDYRKRKHLINHATPDWVDRDDIRHMYKECLRLSEEMKMQLEVDHIVPLKGRNVCGLHVPYNLKVVSHSLNSIKANKFNSRIESRELLEWLKKRKL